MVLGNDVVLRPRFKLKIPHHSESILSDFQNAKTIQSDFIVSQDDEHVFIRFPKDKQNFWSPQLHLQVEPIDDYSSEIRGLFGPNPTVWTMFMFLHFLVACLFIAFGIWTYTDWTLEQNFTIPASLAIFMMLVWVSLYFAGSYGKATSINDIRLLNNFMNEILKIEKAPTENEQPKLFKNKLTQI